MAEAAVTNGNLAIDIAEADRLSRHHHSFKSLMRIFDVSRQHPVLAFPGIPAWIDPCENTQQANNAQTNVEVTDIPDAAVDHEWPSIMDSPACLSRYCLFGSEEDLNSYVDIIIPDIVQTAALVAFHSFQPSMVADDIKKLYSGA